MISRYLVEHLVPSFDGSDDFVGALGPTEGTWVGICFGEEPLDSGLKFDDGSKHAAFESSLGQCGEEPFDGIEPRG